MANKTVLEKQIQAYGQFQSTIRKMSKEDHIRYASTGPLADERERQERDLDARRKAYAQEIKEFEKTRPMTGNLRGLSEEQVHALARQSEEWTKKRRKFDAELKKKYNL